MREFRTEIQAAERAPWRGAEPGVRRGTPRPEFPQGGEATMMGGEACIQSESVGSRDGMNIHLLVGLCPRCIGPRTKSGRPQEQRALVGQAGVSGSLSGSGL